MDVFTNREWDAFNNLFKLLSTSVPAMYVKATFLFSLRLCSGKKPFLFVCILLHLVHLLMYSWRCVLSLKAEILNAINAFCAISEAASSAWSYLMQYGILPGPRDDGIKTELMVSMLLHCHA